jgi:type I restriction enzyme S subunit
VFAFAFNDTPDDIVVTSVNEVFSTDESRLLPEYLVLVFNRPEFDRYARYHSWGSARETFTWNDLTETEIPLPDIETQKQFVAVYGNALKLQKSHEESLADLQLITDTFMDNLAKKSELKPLGDYITQTDRRNRDLAIDNLKGISTGKQFIESKANTTGVSFAGYKVVENGQFAYVADTSRRGDKIALAYNSDKPCIVSSIYTTFAVKNQEQLLPEFLLLWFKRPEFDRYARFNSWGSARETFDWSEMERVQIPVPPLDVQKSIVAIHHALESRKKLNDKLRDALKQLSPVLIKRAKDLVEETV